MDNKNKVKILFNEMLPKVKEDIERLCTNFFFENIDNPINNMRKRIFSKNYKNYIDLKADLPNDISVELDNIFNDDKLNIKLSDTKEEIEDEIHNKIIMEIKNILLNYEINNSNFILPPLKTEISFFEDIKIIKRDFRKQMEDVMPANWFTNLFQTKKSLNHKTNLLLDKLYEKLHVLSNDKKEQILKNVRKYLDIIYKQIL